MGNFSVRCMDWKGWKSAVSASLIYEYMVRSYGTERLNSFHLGNSSISKPTTFPVGDPAYDFLVECLILVHDSLGDYRQIVLNVTVSVNSINIRFFF